MNGHNKSQSLLLLMFLVLNAPQPVWGNPQEWGKAQQESVEQQQKEIASQVEKLLATKEYSTKYSRFNAEAVREYWLGHLLCGYNSGDSMSSLADEGARTRAFENGIMHLRKAISLDPNLSDAYVALGDALEDKSFRFVKVEDRKKGEALREEGFQMYKKAVEIDPTNVEARFNYGRSLKDPKERLREIQTVLALDPKHGEAHDKLGEIYESIGDHKRAIEEYKKQIEICPSCIYTYERLIKLLAESGQVEELKETCLMYAKNDPRSIMFIIGASTPSEAFPGGLLQLEKEHALKGISDIIEAMATQSLLRTSNDGAVAAFRLLLHREPQRREAIIKFLEDYESKYKAESKGQYKGPRPVDPVKVFLAELKAK